MIILPRTAAGAGTGCFSKERLYSGEAIFVQFYPNNTVELSGFVPDGVHAVKLQFVDGSSRSLPVRWNGYYAHVGKATKSVTFEGPAGHVTVPADRREG